MSDIHIYILVVIVIVSFQTMMKRYGWKRKRKGPAKRRRTYSVPKGRYSNRMIGYALALRRKHFSKVDIIRFYQTVFGQESPSPTVICRLYSTILYIPNLHSRASTPDSLPDTLILGSGSESDDDGRPRRRGPVRQRHRIFQYTEYSDEDITTSGDEVYQPTGDEVYQPKEE